MTLTQAHYYLPAQWGQLKSVAKLKLGVRVLVNFEGSGGTICQKCIDNVFMLILYVTDPHSDNYGTANQARNLQ